MRRLVSRVQINLPALLCALLSCASRSSHHDFERVDHEPGVFEHPPLRSTRPNVLDFEALAVVEGYARNCEGDVIEGIVTARSGALPVGPGNLAETDIGSDGYYRLEVREGDILVEATGPDGPVGQSVTLLPGEHRVLNFGPHLDPDEQLFMWRSSCFGRCLEYTVSASTHGNLEWTERPNVWDTSAGKVPLEFDGATQRKITETLRELAPLLDAYRLDARRIRDVQYIGYAFRVDGRAYGTCHPLRRAPPKIRELEDRLERLVLDGNPKRMQRRGSRRYRPPDQTAMAEAYVPGQVAVEAPRLDPPSPADPTDPTVGAPVAPSPESPAVQVLANLERGILAGDEVVWLAPGQPLYWHKVGTEGVSAKQRSDRPVFVRVVSRGARVEVITEGWLANWRLYVDAAAFAPATLSHVRLAPTIAKVKIDAGKPGRWVKRGAPVVIRRTKGAFVEVEVEGFRGWIEANQVGTTFTQGPPEHASLRYMTRATSLRTGPNGKTLAMMPVRNRSRVLYSETDGDYVKTRHFPGDNEFAYYLGYAPIADVTTPSSYPAHIKGPPPATARGPMREEGPVRARRGPTRPRDR